MLRFLPKLCKMNRQRKASEKNYKKIRKNSNAVKEILKAQKSLGTDLNSTLVVSIPSNHSVDPL